jgi:hypothetical protein
MKGTSKKTGQNIMSEEDKTLRTVVFCAIYNANNSQVNSDSHLTPELKFCVMLENNAHLDKVL